jgi:nucleotide-binding universal stress UspA family protein
MAALFASVYARGEAGGGTMFNGSILVATDGSALSEKAIATAVDLARLAGAKLIGFTAVEPYRYAGIGESSGVAASDHQARIGAEASARLAVVARLARAAGVECHTSMLEADEPYRATIAAAEKHGCGLIVMASHGRRGMRALVLGSETQRVLTHTTLPVLVVR